MRSSGRAAAAFVLGLTLVAGVEAQSNQSKELYTEAVAREQGLRREMEALRPGATSESVAPRCGCSKP
jgi:hypothetical protein